MTEIIKAIDDLIGLSMIYERHQNKSNLTWVNNYRNNLIKMIKDYKEDCNCKK